MVNIILFQRCKLPKFLLEIYSKWEANVVNIIGAVTGENKSSFSVDKILEEKVLRMCKKAADPELFFTSKLGTN